MKNLDLLPLTAEAKKRLEEFARQYRRMAHIVIEVLTQYARLRIVLPMIKMKLENYIQKVIIPISTVTILSPIIPSIVYFHLESYWMRKA